METSGKRKRDLGCPRITFHAPGRTFERLLREDSLKELKDAIKRKLGLASNAVISLSQLRGDSIVDLEDEDDFDAFYNVLHTASIASVRVNVSRAVTESGTRSTEAGQPPKQKKHKLDVMLQPSPLQPSSTETPASTSLLPAPTSRKRAVSFEVNDQPGSHQANAPLSKRPKLGSVGIHEADASAQKSIPPRAGPLEQDANVGVSSELEKEVDIRNAGIPTSQSASVDPTQGKGVDGTKKQRQKKKGTPEVSSLPGVGASGHSTAKTLLNSQEKTGATHDKQPTVESTSEPGPVVTAVTNQPLSGGGINQDDTLPKKSKPSALTKASQRDTLGTEKLKKTSRSKSKVRESTSAVESETNETVSSAPNAQLNESLANISRQMIEKYFLPTSSTDVDIGVSSNKSTKTKATPPTQITSRDIPPEPTCPYCGKPLTHDRSRCPLIRTKNPELIETRISELKQNTGEDANNDWENVIEVLQGALLRVRGKQLKNGTILNDSSGPASYIEPPSTQSQAKATTASSVKKSLSSRLLPSPSSSSSSEEENNPEESFSPHPPALRALPLSHSPNTASVALSPLPNKPSPPNTPSVDDASQSNSHSEYETSQSGTTSHDGEGSSPNENDSSSDDDEPSKNPQPQSRLRLPSIPLPGDVSVYSDKDLDALVRGPDVPFTSAELLSSPESSEDEGPGDVQMIYESDEEPRGRSRMVWTSFTSSQDSEEEADGNDDDEDEPFHTQGRDPKLPLVPEFGPTNTNKDGEEEESHLTSVPNVGESQPPEGEASFQELNGRSGSVEADSAGNEAFEQALVEENAVFDLATRQSPPIVNEVTSASTSTNSRRASSMFGANVVTQEPQPKPVEAQTRDSISGTPEGGVEDGAAQAALPDLVEPPGAVGVANALQRSFIEVISDNENEPSSIPTPEPREAPERASTPKPGLMQRMRGRASLASQPKKQPSNPILTSNLTTMPTVKPRSTRAATLRSRPLPSKAGSHDIELDHGGARIDPDVAPSAAPSGLPGPKGDAASSTKPVSARAKAASKKKARTIDESEEEKDILPRRSIRTTSKASSTDSSTVVAPPSGSQPPVRRTRQTKTIAVNDDMTNSSQLPVKKSAKVTKAVVQSPSLAQTNEDADVDGSRSRATEEATRHPSPAVSLNVWEVMSPETPVHTIQSDLIDELHSEVESIPFPLKPQPTPKSVPLRKNTHSRLEQAMLESQGRGKGKAKAKRKDKTPLFMHSDSQTAFPHSQFQSQAQDPIESDSSDSEAEVREAVVKQPTATEPQPSRYRRLSDMASQAAQLFTPKILRKTVGTSHPSGSVSAKGRDRISHMYGMLGKMGDDDSDDGSGQASDSEAEKISHIPKSRRAGAGLKGRKSAA